MTNPNSGHGVRLSMFHGLRLEGFDAGHFVIYFYSVVSYLDIENVMTVHLFSLFLFLSNDPSLSARVRLVFFQFIVTAELPLITFNHSSPQQPASSPPPLPPFHHVYHNSPSHCTANTMEISFPRPPLQDAVA